MYGHLVPGKAKSDRYVLNPFSVNAILSQNLLKVYTRKEVHSKLILLV